ncbi:hypothetical protein ACOME3_002646 [Neoechinorhynchus agilis]
MGRPISSTALRNWRSDPYYKRDELLSGDEGTSEIVDISRKMTTLENEENDLTESAIKRNSERSSAKKYNHFSKNIVEDTKTEKQGKIKNRQRKHSLPAGEDREWSSEIVDFVLNGPLITKDGYEFSNKAVRYKRHNMRSMMQDPNDRTKKIVDFRRSYIPDDSEDQALDNGEDNWSSSVVNTGIYELPVLSHKIAELNHEAPLINSDVQWRSKRIYWPRLDGVHSPSNYAMDYSQIPRGINDFRKRFL